MEMTKRTNYFTQRSIK